MNGIVCLILAILGAILILLGAWMTYRDWKSRPPVDPSKPRPESVSENITALTRLLETLKGVPPGQWLIVLGVVILILAIAFCGVGGLTGGNHS